MENWRSAKRKDPKKSNKLTLTKIFCDKILKFKIYKNESIFKF